MRTAHCFAGPFVAVSTLGGASCSSFRIPVAAREIKKQPLYLEYLTLWVPQPTGGERSSGFLIGLNGKRKADPWRTLSGLLDECADLSSSSPSSSSASLSSPLSSFLSSHSRQYSSLSRHAPKTETCAGPCAGDTDHCSLMHETFMWCWRALFSFAPCFRKHLSSQISFALPTMVAAAAPADLPNAWVRGCVRSWSCSPRHHSASTPRFRSLVQTSRPWCRQTHSI